MERKNQYRTTLKNVPLLYQETKRINQMLLNEISDEEIMQKVVEEDLLQLSSAAQRRTAGKEILYRLSLTNITIQEMIQDEDIQTSKSLVVYSILCADRLLQEFGRELYLDKLLTIHSDISKNEVIRFIERKAENEQVIGKWKEYTYDRLASSFLQIFKEASWIKEIKKSTYQIEKPFISTNSRNYLKKEGYTPAVEVVLGELL